MDLIDIYVLLRFTENIPEILKECDKALSLSKETNSTSTEWIIFRKGTFFVAMNETDKAMAAAEDLRRVLEIGISVNQKSLYPLLLGKIEFAQGDFIWNTLGCSGDGVGNNCTFASLNLTFQWAPFQEDSVAYENFVLETSNQDFELTL